MVTPLQKWDVKAHLSNKEIRPRLPLLLTHWVEPVCGWWVNELSVSKLSSGFDQCGLVSWGIRSLQIRSLQSSWCRVRNKSLAHLHTTLQQWLWMFAPPVQRNEICGNCWTCSYSGCTSAITTSVCLLHSCTAVKHSVLDQSSTE